MKIWQEFKEFAVRGNVVDMAVGIIIGTAFGAIANSLVKDVIMPPLGAVLSNADFSDFFLVIKAGTPPGPYANLSQAGQAHAITMNLGLFINVVINFFIVAFAVFMLVRVVNRLQRPKVAHDQKCPYCLMSIPLKASRCGHCTAELPQENPDTPKI